MGKVLVYGLELLGTGKSTRLDESLKTSMNELLNLTESTQVTWREKLHVKAINQWSEG